MARTQQDLRRRRARAHFASRAHLKEGGEREGDVSLTRDRLRVLTGQREGGGERGRDISASEHGAGRCSCRLSTSMSCKPSRLRSRLNKSTSSSSTSRQDILVRHTENGSSRCRRMSNLIAMLRQVLRSTRLPHTTQRYTTSSPLPHTGQACLKN
jgi:hypothetical protein